MDKEIQDFWSEDDFENTVASAIISCFETKVLKNKGAPPADRLTEERVALFRNAGPYIPSNSRIIVAPADDTNGKWEFDLQNDRLPESGCFATPSGGKLKESEPDSYMHIFYFRKAAQLGKFWHQLSGGTLYEMYTLAAMGPGGISGERRYFTVDKNGLIHSCIQRLPDSRGFNPGAPVGMIETEKHYMDETEAWGSTALQYVADRRFSWSITAEEKQAKAHLGCMQEEIKSLLYARSLPMTETGRKRPILHLIESHKRRLRSGIDIDIVPFLRGTQAVEINGTLFKVNPPTQLKDRLSKNSQARYYESNK